MDSENDNDDKCWDVTDDIINNADCICEMCNEIV